MVVGDSPERGGKGAAWTPARAIDRALREYVDSLAVAERLREAIGYALLSGGKRLRPVLAWHACVAAGGAGEQSLPAGIALELVHCFSLVHDDLPAMDDDDLRRGIPTLHRHAGEAMAILAGDAMLALAFEVLLATPDAERATVLARELGAGTRAMIVGQVYDTLGGLPRDVTGEARLEMVHRNKTGALIRAACRMGALSAGSDAATLAALTRYGETIGLMFQIVDDLLDVEQTEEATGKRTGKDQDKGKLTYPGVLGRQGSRDRVKILAAEAHAAITAIGPRAEALGHLASDLAVRTN